MTSAGAVDVDELIVRLHLQPHPEGGWWSPTFLGPLGALGRPTGSAILFLLRAGERSHWHRLDVDEVWHFNDGDPLELRQVHASGRSVTVLDRCSAGRSSVPQVLVPAGSWQTARTLGRWSAVGCSTAPGFTMAGFELAPAGWEPPSDPEAPDPGSAR